MYPPPLFLFLRDGTQTIRALFPHMLYTSIQQDHCLDGYGPSLSFNSEIHVKIMFLYKIYIPFPLHFLFYEGWNPSDQGFVSSHVIRQYTAGSLPGWLWPQPLVSIVNFSVKIMLFTIDNHLIQFSLNNDKKSMRLPFSVHMLPTEHFT